MNLRVNKIENRLTRNLGLTIFAAFAVGLISFFAADQCFAVTKSKIKSKKLEPWVRDSAELKMSLRLQMTDTVKTVKIPKKQIIIRSKRSKSDERVDPITIRVPTESKALANFVLDIAKPKYKHQIHKDFMNQLSESDKPLPETKKITLSYDLLKKVRLEQVSEKLSHKHHELQLKTGKLRRNKKLRHELFSQLRPFLPESERNLIKKNLRAKRPISVDELLLPAFAKKMVEKYTIYRGPNCFHAALAFHGKNISNSPWFNVKEEKGYHRTMINYDELWRALNRAFYEVDTTQDEVEYGDILVFFDIPFEYKKGPIDFKWIRHTAAYLFDSYTFSKGSKSPDTPYTVKTMDEEWTTWRRYTKNLGVKVYRRSLNRVKKRPPRDLTDWLY